MKDNDEDAELPLFLDIPEDESLLLHHNPDELETPPGSEPGTSPIFKIPFSPTQHNGKNDYDWLLTPPDTSFMSLLDMVPQKCTKILNGTPKACPAELKSKVTDWQEVSSPRSNSSSAGSCRFSSSDSQVSATFKSESPSEHRTIPLSTKSSLHVTPTLRTNLSSSKPMVVTARSRIPSARAPSPTSRPTAPTRKSISRSGTPTRYPSNTLTVSSVSVPPGRSSSVGKLGFKATRNLVPAHGISTVKSKLQKPAEMPGSRVDAAQELRTSITKRPVSTSRCRSGTPNFNGKLRQCSPPKELGPYRSVYSNGNHLPAVRRSYSHDGDNVNPALVGTKMVERVVNMRRLAPPKQDNQFTDSIPKKTSPHGSSGFGRTLSRSSLDMAMRHMDIGRTIAGNSRPMMKKVTASSMYSVKSEVAKSRSTSVPDSLATSSNASSELSLNGTPFSMDLSEPDDDRGSGRS